MKELVSNGKDYFVVWRSIPHHSFPNIESVKKFCDEHPRADHVLNRNGYYLFCETVTNVEDGGENKQ